MGVLEIRGVSKNFGGLQALSNVSLEVQAGSITALIGPNGAGKTTLFNITSGFDQPSKGEAFFEGRVISSLSPSQVARRGISRTFQLIKLFKNMTVLENVMAGRHILTRADPLSILLRLPWVRVEEANIRKRSMELLSFFALEGKANELAANLPAGQQRLLELARALALEPKVVLMDEVAAGLNPYEKEALAQTIKAIQSQGITVFLIEHDMQFVGDIADWTVVLDFGIKIAEGSPKDIRNNTKVIKAYLGYEHDVAS